MILVVEDEPACAQHTCEVLRVCGYKPTWVGSLTEALGVPELEYEAIFLDLLLPDTTRETVADGVSSVRRRFPHTPLIVLSAYLPEFSVMELLRRGADFCLQKPLTRANVSGIVARACEINRGEMSGICARLEAACAH